LLAGVIAPAGAAPPAPDPVKRVLRVEVRDAPPGYGASFVHGADNSYTVSTGGSGASVDARTAPMPDNSATVSTGGAREALRVREGESVRVDLPAIQSLQFRVPAGARGAAAPSSTGAASRTASAGSSSPSPGAPAGASVSGIVSFEAVSAFVARFSVRGREVRIDLVPLHEGGVTAPWTTQAGADSVVVVTGLVGEWIALGDAIVPSGARRLSAGATGTATPAPASGAIWVRVTPDPAGLAP
jgi:hypothetical protein